MQEGVLILSQAWQEIPAETFRGEEEGRKR
jgi:hypothetical protein